MTYANKIEYFQQLISCYRTLIFRACRIYGGGDTDFMRDLFQEVSLALWESLDNFQHRSHESTWVWNVAQKTALYRLRKKKAESAFLQTGLSEDVSQAPTEESRDIEELYAAISRLESDDQMLVTLRLDGKSYSEIALLMGTSEGALRTRHARIVQQLRKLMAV